MTELLGERPGAARAAPTGARKCSVCGAAYDADALFCPADGAPLLARGGQLAEPYLGKLILEHIEIERLVGVGAMGRVYRAHQRGLDRDVAVKILHHELAHNRDVAARFQREAKLSSKVKSPHVVQVLLAGELPDGASYIVMEFLDGLSLQSALAASQSGALPLPRALHIALQLCDGVGEAHGLGIVHRDLKPENVMLVARGDDRDFVKVLDFGIARGSTSDSSASMATAQGLIFGTARYISPEGARGEPASCASDVYSLGILLYQMLAGRTPFDAEQPVGLLLQHIHETPPPLRAPAALPEVPKAIEQVVLAALSKEPAERPADARALGQRLRAVAIECGALPSGAALPQLSPTPPPAQVQAAPLPPAASPPNSSTLPIAAPVSDPAATQPLHGHALEQELRFRLSALPSPAPGAAAAASRPVVRTEFAEPGALPITLDSTGTSRRAPSRTEVAAPAPPIATWRVDAAEPSPEPEEPPRRTRWGLWLLCAAVAMVGGALVVAGASEWLEPDPAEPAAAVPTSAPAPPSVVPPVASSAGDQTNGEGELLPLQGAQAPEAPTSVPPPRTAQNPVAPASPAGAASQTSPKARLVVTTRKPASGQPVGFTAAVTLGSRNVSASVQDASFSVRSPSGVHALSTTLAGGSTFTSQFTPSEGGAHEISFSGVAFGAPVRSTQRFQVGGAPLDPSPAPATSATALPPPLAPVLPALPETAPSPTEPRPAASVKWL